MSSVDSLGRLRSLAAYYKEILAAQIRTTGRHYLDLGAVFSRGLVADLSPFVSSFDELVTRSELRFRIEPASSKDIETTLEAAEKEETPGN